MSIKINSTIMAANNVVNNVVEYYEGMDIGFPFGNDHIQLDIHNDSVNMFNTLVTNKIFTPDNGTTPEDLQVRVSKKVKFYVGSNGENTNGNYSMAISDSETHSILESPNNLRFSADSLQLKSLVVEEPSSLVDTAKLTMDKHLLFQSTKNLRVSGDAEFTNDINISKNLYVGKSIIFQEASTSNDQVRIGMHYNQDKDCLDVVKQQEIGGSTNKRLLARLGLGGVNNQVNDSELDDIPFYKQYSAQITNSNETSAAPNYQVANTWSVTDNKQTLYYGEKQGANVGVGLSNIGGQDSKFTVIGESKINGITLNEQNDISGLNAIDVDTLHVRSFEATEGFTMTTPVDMEDVNFASITFKNMPAGALPTTTLPTETFAVPFNTNANYWTEQGIVDTTGPLVPAQLAKLTASDGAAGDQFGWSVAIDGDTMVVGAYEKDSGKGAVYVFTRNTAGNITSGWTQRAKLTASDGSANDNFGHSVSIDGDTVVVGAPEEDYSIAPHQIVVNCGAAYVFTRDTAGDLTSGWTEVAKLMASDIGPTIRDGRNDRFGHCVSIAGDTMVIGAPAGVDRGGGTGAVEGSMYVFTRNMAGDLTSGWTELAKLTASDGASNDRFGRHPMGISIGGDTIVIGAWQEGGNGSAYVFTRNTAGDLTSGWTERAKLTASDISAIAHFGWSVSIDGDTLVIGADIGVTGSAYVFTRNVAGDLTSGWTERAKLTASDGAQFNHFGYSVSIDGDTIVVGSANNDAAPNNPSSGSVYVFTRDTVGDLTSGWTQEAQLTASDGPPGTSFGRSVSIDGHTVVVGWDGDASKSGSAYVYRLRSLIENPMHMMIQAGSAFNPSQSGVDGYSRSAIFVDPIYRTQLLSTTFDNSTSKITLPSDFNSFSKLTASITGYYEGYGCKNQGTSSYFPLQVVAVVGGTLTSDGEWDTLPTKMATVDFNPHPAFTWPSDQNDIISGVTAYVGVGNPNPNPDPNKIIFDNATLSTTLMTTGTFAAGDVVQFLIGVPSGQKFGRVFDGPAADGTFADDGVSFSMSVSFEYTEGQEFDGRLSKLNNDIFPLDVVPGNNDVSIFNNDAAYISNIHEIPIKKDGKWRIQEWGDDLIVQKKINGSWIQIFRFED